MQSRRHVLDLTDGGASISPDSRRRASAACHSLSKPETDGSVAGLACAFGQASQTLTWPSPREPAGAGVRATVPASRQRSDSLRVWTPGVA